MGTKRSTGGRAAAALLPMALGALAAPAEAVTIGFPCAVEQSGGQAQPCTPTESLQSSLLRDLDQAGGYQVDFSGNLTAPGTITVTGSVTFTAPEVSESDFVAGLLVFTSLRNIPASEIACPLDESSRVPMGMVLESIQGIDGAPAFAHDDTGPGTICDAEGDVFPALRFDTTQGASRSFSFDLVFEPDAIDLDSLDLQILNAGFAVVVPEPHTFALLLGGLGGLGVLGLRRGGRGA